MKFFNPTGTKKNIGLKPLSQRLATVQDKSIVFYYSWQDGSLYDGQFSDILAEMFKSAGATVTQIYKRKAFDQNDVEERKNIGKHDAVIYFGASSCSTSKFATVYGGLIDSEEQTPTVVVTYNTFKNDCIHANYENGNKNALCLHRLSWRLFIIRCYFNSFSKYFRSSTAAIKQHRNGIWRIFFP